jgi:hypothetical protein
MMPAKGPMTSLSLGLCRDLTAPDGRSLTSFIAGRCFDGSCGTPSRHKPIIDLSSEHQHAEPEAAEWQAAMEALILVATSGGPTMSARIGVMRALNRHVERALNPDRKDPHWGRRKLKRDK